MPVKLPSRVAARRTRCMEAPRCVVTWAICWRVNATLTGRFNSRAASAARIASPYTGSLPPKPPPMNSAITSTWSGLILSVEAMHWCADSTSWTADRTVRRLPDHSAVLACGSIWLWFW